jgi:hypothetical protein
MINKVPTNSIASPLHNIEWVGYLMILNGGLRCWFTPKLVGTTVKKNSFKLSLNIQNLLCLD